MGRNKQSDLLFRDRVVRGGDTNMNKTYDILGLTPEEYDVLSSVRELMMFHDGDYAKWEYRYDKIHVTICHDTSPLFEEE